MRQEDSLKPYIIVSACLLGSKVRFDGTSKLVQAALALTEFYNVIPICPEMDSGMSVPRDPSEIRDGKVISNRGKDVTSYYIKGARMALEAAMKHKVKLAVLKDRSPSCGSQFIHDGLFDNKVIKGQGLTASLFISHGIDVISENQLDALIKNLYQKRQEEENQSK